ncbi:hypothetical protein PINS_up000909 [Pythium insidiosum]|nr:hypothetical protein PINS_up000909 [Pythium insidiosum]
MGGSGTIPDAICDDAHQRNRSKCTFGIGEHTRCLSSLPIWFAKSIARMTSTVQLSAPAFCAAWLCILALHGGCTVYFAFVGRLYWTMPGTYLDTCFDYYQLGMKNTHYATLAVVHIVIASVHGAAGGVMLLMSTWYRRLMFAPWNEDGEETSVATAPTTSDLLVPESTGMKARWKARLRKAFDVVFGRRGFFGVEGHFFDLLLIIRETTELSLQTVQAYRMSLYLPRVWLNRGYIALLVLNCWLTPVIDHIVQRDAMRRRMLVLCCDTVLDLIVAVGIPVVLLTTYLPDYNTSMKGFPIAFWYNDAWMVNVKNEFQLLLVASWSDLLSRVVFSLGLLGCLDSIKDIIRMRPLSSAVAPDVSFVPAKANEFGPSAFDLGGPQALAIVPDAPAPAKPATRREGRLTSSMRLLQAVAHSRRLHRAFHVLLLVWGVIVLALHLHAETQPSLDDQCLTQLRPWLRAKPSCALLLLDCTHNNIGGTAAETAALWSVSDPLSVYRVYVRHCPTLEMPPQIHQFNGLSSLKLYNVSVTAWSSTSTLDNAHFPALISLLVVRTNFSGGEIPDGLLSRDWPQQLLDIEFCVTNLRSLPDVIDSIWPSNAYYYFEHALFELIPPSLLRLHPSQLSVAGNRLSAFPFEALRVDGIAHLNVGANKLSTLFPPSGNTSDVVDIGVIEYLYMNDLAIRAVPKWLDPMIQRFRDVDNFIHVIMTRTPFCDLMAAVRNGSLAAFPMENGTTPDELSFVMNMTEPAEIRELFTLVNCRYNDTLFYPLRFEDKWSALS